MNKVFNWTIGSFFRTIGRMLAFFVVGIAIAYILAQSDLKIGNIFRYTLGVHASTFSNIWVPTYSDANRTVLSTSKTIASNIDNNFTTTKFYYARGYNLHNWAGADYTGGQIIIPFNLTTPIFSVNTTSTITHQSYCDRWEWQSIDSYNNVIKWKCANYNFGVDDDHITDREYIYPTTSIKAVLHTIYNNTSYDELCQVKDNAFYCPIGLAQEELDYIEIFTNVNYGSTTNTKDYNLSIDYFVNIEFDGTANAINSNTQAINSQTQQEQQQHEEIMDSNTTQAEDDAQDFFESFDAPDVGGLSAIITAPLSTIQSLLNATCTNLVLPLPFVNKNLTLPCMNDIYTQHFGAFFSLYQTIILGIIAYRCIRSIFFDLQGFADPSDDRIEVMDL